MGLCLRDTQSQTLQTDVSFQILAQFIPIKGFTDAPLIQVVRNIGNLIHAGVLQDFATDTEQLSPWQQCSVK